MGGKSIKDEAIEIPRSVKLLIEVMTGTLDAKGSEPVRSLIESVYREGYRDGAFAEKMRSSLGD